MNRTWKYIVAAVIVVVVGFAAFGAGLAIGSLRPLASMLRGPTEEPEQFDVFWEAWSLVERNFVDREALDPTLMTYGAIRGMVNALGDEGHTAFLTPEERERQQAGLSGKFSGIGAQLGIRDSLPVVVAPFDGSPAAAAGVKAGDIILQVDGTDVTTMTIADVAALIRGPENTQVVLSLWRPDENRNVELTITRQEITVPAATWAMVPGTEIGLIRLSQFSANAYADIVASVEGAEAAGATGLIIDVRNNPGGLLEQAIKVTSQFLAEGNVLLEEDADGNRRAFKVESGGVATTLPIVVLINPGSASSAEIFAGAVQDHGRGVLIGETTFGTGTVLQPYALQDGSALLLGTKQWLTPEGRLIRKQGVEPDVQLELPMGADLLIPQEVQQLEREELWQSEDKQLLKALEVLGVEPLAIIE
jgi:carboxyl-terminal processing protease